MAEATDVLIAFLGPTLVVVPKTMTDTVPPVSNTSFQKMREVRSIMLALKRSVFAMQSMNSLKGSSMTSLCIQVIATVP